MEKRKLYNNTPVYRAELAESCHLKVLTDNSREAHWLFESLNSKLYQLL